MKFSNYTIATLGSHSALQILKGAKDEGFKTLCICLTGKEKPYQMFNVADKIISIRSYKDFTDLDKKFCKQNVIFIPHASLISYIGFKKTEQLKTKYFGNKKILEWESNRNMERIWLKKSGLILPKIYKSPKDIDCIVIVKFHGASGGSGYFLAKNEKDFNKKIGSRKPEQYIIQEYIIGVPIFAHYFYSSIENKIELMGFDKRYESNADSLGRISARDQLILNNIDPSYTICGNFPIVIRESYLTEIIEMGERVVEASKTVVQKGLFGPFCLELIITPDGKIFCFEISARIVAGTNPYIDGSPYSSLLYKEPMSTGRRIAREIKNAINANKLEKILD